MPTVTPPIAERIRSVAKVLPHVSDPNFASFFDQFANAKIVLIGDASHGTSEFYRGRANITKRLIEQFGFNIVAVEADYPDASSIDHYVRQLPYSPIFENAFTRFPTWMWRNKEVQEFVDWLKIHNDSLPKNEKTRFYGLDLYSLNTSIHAVTEYLDKVDPESSKLARQRYGCLTPWVSNPAMYGLDSLTRGYAKCEKAVLDTLRDLLSNRLNYITKLADGEEFFMDAEQNAKLVADAEAYYRAMYYGAEESWNLRDTHMFETLERILKFRSDFNPKAIVWAHNSHIGDARFTDMGIRRKELNIGQLCRQKYGNEVCLIGFGTHTGTVAAADEWDSPMKIMKVNPSRSDSYERLAHDAGLTSFLLDLRENGCNEDLRKELLKPKLERFIGVIYRPNTERWSHYSEVILPKQLDAYIWVDETSAVTPLKAKEKRVPKEFEETYPFGL